MIRPTRMNNVALKVRDLQESMDWYDKHFGFKFIHSAQGCVVIGSDEIELVLSPHSDPNAPLADPQEVRCIHTLGFEIKEEQFDQAVEEFMVEDPDMVAFDQYEFRSIIVSDPDGYCVKLYFNKREKQPCVSEVKTARPIRRTMPFTGKGQK